MNIRQMPLKDLRPYERNPRKNDGAVDAVAESIRQYGFLVPLVVSPAGEIVPATHGTKPLKSWSLKLCPASLPTS